MAGVSSQARSAASTWLRPGSASLKISWYRGSKHWLLSTCAGAAAAKARPTQTLAALSAAQLGAFTSDQLRAIVQGNPGEIFNRLTLAFGAEKLEAGSMKVKLAEAEGLNAHAQAARMRL